MKYTFTFNLNNYDFDFYYSEFMSLIIKHIDDPKPLYDKGHFRVEDNFKSHRHMKQIYPTFTQFLNGEYYDVSYTKFTVELNLGEKEQKLFNSLVEKTLKNKQTELLTEVLKTSANKKKLPQLRCVKQHIFLQTKTKPHPKQGWGFAEKEKQNEHTR